VAVVLAVKAASRAFSDSIDIDDDEWEQLVDSMMQKAMMAPVSGPEGSVPQAPATSSGDPSAAGDASSPIDSLPPEAKQALVAMIQQGVAPPVALQKVLQALGNGNAPSTPTAQ
jgi:guanyl-specific ribonuclease Sa